MGTGAARGFGLMRALPHAMWGAARLAVGGRGTMHVVATDPLSRSSPMTLNRRRFTSLLAAGAASLAPTRIWAQAHAQAQAAPRMVEGQPFVQRLRLLDTDLALNGTGVRAVAWFKGYAVGLYLPQRANSTAQVLAQPGPKRLQLRMLQEVPAAEFVKALNKGIERNSSPAEWSALAPRVQRFSEQITSSGAVRKREVVDLDFDPARGLLFARNGKLVGEAIPGADLYAALLRAFIGEHPYDDRMKAGLLAATGP